MVRVYETYSFLLIILLKKLNFDNNLYTHTHTNTYKLCAFNKKYKFKLCKIVLLFC